MKKLLSLILALALLLGLLAGCGTAASTEKAESAVPAAEESSAAASNESEEPAQAEEPEENEAAVEAEDAEEAASEEEPAQEESQEDEYEKVSYELPLFEEAPAFSAFYPLRNTNNASLPSHDSEDYPFWARVQENLNVDLTFKEPAQDVCAEQYNLMLASGDYTDLIFESMINSTGCAYAAGYDSAIEEDIYVDLMPYMEYAPNYAHYILGNEDNKKAVVTDNGAIGAFMKVLSEPEKTNIGLCVRTEYMDATGMEIPDTVDGWMEVFEAMSNNGVKYPINVTNTGNMLNGYIENAMGACISTKFLVDAESGDLVFGPTTDETRQYIELFIECADKGWMDPDWISFTGMENPLFTDGSIATCQQIAPRLPTVSQQLGFEITACPLIHRDGYGAGQLAIGNLTNPLASSGGGIAVTTACDDVESVCKMLDWMYSDEGAEIINYGWIEGETYYVENGKRYINNFYSATNEDYGCGNKTLYTNDRDFAYTYPNVAYEVAVEVQQHANDVWTVDPSNEATIYLSLPDAVALNSDESAELTTLISDLDTYIQSTFFGWMCQTVPFDDAAWETFLKTCDEMSLPQIQAGYEAAYERYNG